MSAIQKYDEVIKSTNEIALATSVDSIPNVRIVNFCYKPEQPNILYFASDRDNRKVIEFRENSRVAFTTIPLSPDSIPHIRSNNAVVQKSMFSIDDVKDLFINSVPGYDETLAAIGETLDVFEIHVKEAIVITGFEEPDFITF